MPPGTRGQARSQSRERPRRTSRARRPEEPTLVAAAPLTRVRSHPRQRLAARSPPLRRSLAPYTRARRSQSRERPRRTSRARRPEEPTLVAAAPHTRVRPHSDGRPRARDRNHTGEAMTAPRVNAEPPTEHEHHGGGASEHERAQMHAMPTRRARDRSTGPAIIEAGRERARRRANARAASPALAMRPVDRASHRGGGASEHVDARMHAVPARRAALDRSTGRGDPQRVEPHVLADGRLRPVGDLSRCSGSPGR
jgi:hypothetical protein